MQYVPLLMWKYGEAVHKMVKSESRFNLHNSVHLWVHSSTLTQARHPCVDILAHATQLPKCWHIVTTTVIKQRDSQEVTLRKSLPKIISVSCLVTLFDSLWQLSPRLHKEMSQPYNPSLFGGRTVWRQRSDRSFLVHRYSCCSLLQHSWIRCEDMFVLGPWDDEKMKNGGVILFLLWIILALMPIYTRAESCSAVEYVSNLWDYYWIQPGNKTIKIRPHSVDVLDHMFVPQLIVSHYKFSL